MIEQISDNVDADTLESMNQDENFPTATNPDAIEDIATESKSPTTAINEPIQRDSSGIKLGKRHARDAQGRPLLTRTGRFKLKKNHTKNEHKKPKNSESTVASDEESTVASDEEKIKQQEDRQKQIQLASVTSKLLEQMQMKLISDAFRYDPTESENNINAWLAMYDSVGGVKLSPAGELFLSHTAIIVARSREKDTVDAFSNLKNKIIKFAIAIRNNFLKKKIFNKTTAVGGVTNKVQSKQG